ncbi:MAG: hypothetical protein NC037_06580 [Bacteroides sp.]|nr:hypothetical protein [Bacillota bacterium]MCM1394426.1 hypothetical protein [[Eubacterium] siraeum]MCM1456170.1 hypothetical protein [Bacteroides sp.]
MSIISENNLYGAMLYNYGARSYLAQPVCMRNIDGNFTLKGELTMPLHFCDAASSYIYHMQDVAESDVENEVKFFIYAAHVVFVPFGQAGYDFLKKTVAEKQGKSVGEFLYEKFVERVECPLNGNLLKDLDDEQRDYIKEFFVNFENRDDINCSEPKDLATLVCRLFFALDALLANTRKDIQDLSEKYIEPMEDEIIDFENEYFTCKLSDLIGRIPTREPLDTQEENYILNLFFDE